MPIIAMTSKMGSGGRDVAQRLAGRMGLKLVEHELIHHTLAEKLRVRESVVRHCLEGRATVLEKWQIGTKRLMRYFEAEILDLALQRDVLFFGCGSCVVLRGMPHIPRVRVSAPMDIRERAVMQRLALGDRSAARQELERNDAAQKRTLRDAFGVDREDPALFDLLLNTERNSAETCVQLVWDLTERPEFRETELARAILEDKALEARIRLELGERFTFGTGVSGIEASARSGKVLLRGTAIHTTLAAEAGRIVTAIVGVNEVQNDIIVRRGRSGGIGGKRQRAASLMHFMSRARLSLRRVHLRGGPLAIGEGSVI